jgi:hypothetical protein
MLGGRIWEGEHKGTPRRWESRPMRHENEPRLCRGSFLALPSMRTPHRRYVLPRSYACGQSKIRAA